jgi:hypothetical protein
MKKSFAILHKMCYPTNVITEEKKTSMNYLTRYPILCKYYEKGFCKFGDNCMYIHKKQYECTNQKIIGVQSIECKQEFFKEMNPLFSKNELVIKRHTDIFQYLNNFPKDISKIINGYYNDFDTLKGISFTFSTEKNVCFTTLHNGHIITGSLDDKNIRIWDQNGTCDYVRSLSHTVDKIAALSDGRVVCSGLLTSTIVNKSNNHTNCIHLDGPLPSHGSDSVKYVGVFPNGKIITVTNNSIDIYGDRSRNSESFYRIPGIIAVTILSNTHIAIIKSHKMIILNLRTRQEESFHNSNTMYCMDQLYDGRIVTGSCNEIKIWNLLPQKCDMVIKYSGITIDVIGLSNGKILSFSKHDGPARTELNIWDSSSGNCLVTLTDFSSSSFWNNMSNRIAVLPDGAIVCAFSNNTLTILK